MGKFVIIKNKEIGGGGFMIITAKMRLGLVLISTVLFIGILLISQIKQRKGIKTILLSVGAGGLGSLLLVIGMSFLDSYHYLLSSYLSDLFQFTPIFVQPMWFESFLFEKWFVIFSVVLMAWIINLAFVYYTKWKYLFLTPASPILLTTLLLYFMQFGRLTLSSQLILITIMLGIIMTVAPYITAKMCRKANENQPVIGGFFYLNLWLCLGFSLLFGKCESTTESSLTHIRGGRFFKRVGWMIFLGTSLLSVLLIILSWIKDYNHQIRLIIFDQFVAEGLSLQFFYLMSLWIGLGCLYLTYRLVMPLYADYFNFFNAFNLPVHFATDWLYQLKHTKSVAVIGFFLSYLTAVVTLMYLSFYQWQEVIIPNFIWVGVIGIIVAKMGDQVNGIKGCIMASLMNGFLLTMIPTLSFYWLQNQQLEMAFGSIDYFFVSQLLDILSIF